MRLPLWLVFWSATACSALSILQPDQNVLRDKSDSDRFLIELELGVTRWITEDEKWELRRVCRTSEKNSTTPFSANLKYI